MAGEICEVCGRALPGHKMGGESCKALGYERLRTALAAAEAREAEMRIREGDMFFEATRRMLEGNELREKLAAAEGREAAARLAALEEAASVAENWGNAPPNPRGRRAALAREIRALAHDGPPEHDCINKMAVDLLDYLPCDTCDAYDDRALAAQGKEG